jgi:hypothetical protein
MYRSAYLLRVPSLSRRYHTPPIKIVIILITAIPTQAFSYACSPPRYDPWIGFFTALQAMHGGKGKPFLDGWKELQRRGSLIFLDCI